jgi:transcriptional/translational regulatory protein YebC/TACO1
MFERKGLIVAQKSEDLDEDTIMLMAIEAGAEDISPAGVSYEIVTPASDLNRVKEFLFQQGVKIESAELTILPKNQIKLDSQRALKVLKFIEALEDHDDVQEVYVNFEIPDEVMAQLT